MLTFQTTKQDKNKNMKMELIKNIRQICRNIMPTKKITNHFLLDKKKILILIDLKNDQK